MWCVDTKATTYCIKAAILTRPVIGVGHAHQGSAHAEPSHLKATANRRAHALADGDAPFGAHIGQHAPFQGRRNGRHCHQRDATGASDPGSPPLGHKGCTHVAQSCVVLTSLTSDLSESLVTGDYKHPSRTPYSCTGDGCVRLHSTLYPYRTKDPVTQLSNLLR